MTKSTFLQNTLSRRSFVALGSAGLLAAGMGGRAFAQDANELTVQLNWLETADFAPLFAAELRGLDTARGVRQVFIPGGPQVDPVQSVAAGSAPVGLAGSIGQLALARASGIPVKMIGALYRSSPAGIISHADAPINTVADAVGKRIGLQGGARITWSIMLAVNGIEESQMTIVPVAADVSPLVSRQVDAYWGTAVNQHLALERQGVPNHILTRGDAGAPEHFEVLFAMENTLGERREDIVAWLAALIEGQQAVIENPDEIAAHVVNRAPSLQLNPEQQQAQTAAGLKFIQPKGKELPLLEIDVEGAELAIAQQVEQGQIPGPIALSDLYDPSLLQEAYAAIG